VRHVVANKASPCHVFVRGLVYIAGGQRPPGAGIMAECKPNLSLSGVWFTFPAGSARRGLKSRPNVNQIIL